MTIISVEPLAKRILEIAKNAVGTDGRYIPLDSFRVDSTADKSPDLLLQDLEVRPLFEIEDIVLKDARAFSENASVAQYDVQVLLRVSYKVNAGLPDLDRTNLIVRMRNDVHLVRRALGNPETLSLWNSPEGDVDTGLASGCLEFESASKILWTKVETRTVIASQTITFTGKLFLDFVGSGYGSGSLSSSYVGGWYVPLHASTHASGSTDALNAQDLGAFGVPANYLLISNGSGGWTTIASSSVGGGGGAGVSDHGLLSGLSDDDHPQYLLRSDFNPFSASMQSTSGTLLNSSASFSAVSASFVASSASWEARDAVLGAASSSFRAELNSLTSSVVRLDSASGSFSAVSASFAAHSASWEARDGVLTAASASFRAELNLQTASINLLTAFSNSHASRHLSGGVDPIDAHLLRGNGVAANRLLISDGVGGWTTVLSTSVGTPPGAPANHASTHLSGASDAINAHDLGASGVAANRLLISNANGGWTTVASSSVVGKDYDAFTASVQATTASLQTVTASYLAVSASFNVISSSFISNSSSWESRLQILTNASATFRTELTALTSSVVRLDAASGSFRAELNSQTASINLLTAFSNSHASRHLSGAADPIDIQNLRANAQPVGTMFAANAVGGIATVHSGVFFLTSSFSAFSATFQGFSASVQSATASLQTFSASLLAVSASFNALSATYYPVSASFNAISASFISNSASWESRLLVLVNASASFRAELNSQTASINLLTAFSNSHASRHLSGGLDPIDAQSLRANGVTANRLLISNANGGWTTISSSSLAAGGGLVGAISASSIGLSLLSSTVDSVVAIKTLTTSSVQSEASPSSYFISPKSYFVNKEKELLLYDSRLSNRVHVFDDFISFSPSGTLGFGITNGANATTRLEAVERFTLDRKINPVGLINMEISTNAATQGQASVLSLGSGSFALNKMSASLMEWRLMPSGASSTTSQRRLQIGWLSNLASASTLVAQDQNDGVYFEFTATNPNWNIVAVSGGAKTSYDSGYPINSASLSSYAIVITGSHLNIPTASFYINDSLVGVISASIPLRQRLVTPAIKSLRLTGTDVAINTLVDSFELYFETERGEESLVPSEIFGSKLLSWQRADLGVVVSASFATVWLDQSGNGRHFAITSSTNAPGKVFNQGQFALRFSSSRPDLLSLSGTSYGIGPNSSSVHVFRVLRRNVDPAASTPSSGLDDFGTHAAKSHIPFTDGVIYDSTACFSGRATVGDAATSFATLCLYESISTTSKFEARLNGEIIYSGATLAPVIAATPVIGGTSAGAFMEGDIWEHFVLNAEATQEERQKLSRYIFRRYGLVIQ